MDYIAGPAIVGGAMVLIFGGAQFLVGLTFFTARSVIRKIARKRRAQRILRAEAQRWNDTHL